MPSRTFRTLVVFFGSILPYVSAGLLIGWIFTARDVEQEKHFAWLALGAFGAGGAARLIVVEFMRLFVYRLRPFATGKFKPLIPVSAYAASFPSGHAAFFSAIAFFLFFYQPRLGLFFLITCALVSVARIIAGIHYLTDILGGVNGGAIAAGAIRLLFLYLGLI